MLAYNVVFLVLAVFAATPALTARVPSNIESRDPQVGSLVSARSGDGNAALNEIFARNTPVLNNKREKTDSLPGSLDSRAPLPRGISALTLLKFFVIRRFLKGAGIIFHRREISPDQLSARDLLEDLFSGLNTREFGLQEDIHARSAPNAPSETVARDGTVDSFISALFKTRDSEITPKDLLSLARRAFDDLD